MAPPIPPPAPGRKPEPRGELRVLVVEDSQDDYELLVNFLGRSPWNVQARRVEDASGLRAALAAQRWDVVISDHKLPRFDSSAALHIARKADGQVPFIIVSGQIGEDVAVDAMLAGADDYVMKHNLARLRPAVQRCLAASELRREKLEAERAVQESDARAEQALRDSRAALSELAAHWEARMEEERAAIARELHDDVGGTLTALKVDIEQLRRGADGDAQFKERAAEMGRLVDSLIEASTRLAGDLRPAALDFGLSAALEVKAREFEKRVGIPCRFRSNDEELALDPERGRALVRVFQEALTNVIKHARATRVEAELFVTAGEVTLEVRDDGRGLQPADLAKRDSFGVRGMHERVGRIGGWIEVSGEPGKGTTVMVSIPRPRGGP